MAADTGDPKALLFQTYSRAQNGVVAHGRSKAIHQPFCRQPARAVANKMNDFSHSASPARVTRCYFGQLISECLALAFRVSASPTDHPKPEGHDQPLDRQIPQESGHANRAGALTGHRIRDKNR
jgi:hypothetical protein